MSSSPIQNLLVTGGAGFIGSNLIRYLFEETDFQGRIINLDKLTYAGNLQNLEDISKKFPDRYIFIQADLCQFDNLRKVFESFSIDTICHLAAESHVDRSILKPQDFIQTNVVGTFNLLELARWNQHRLRLFHHVSTDEVFGSLEKGLFTEHSPYQPNSPYSASKAASDHLVRAYHKTYELPVTLSNCSNNYGPYQFPEKLIPLMILQALEEKPLPVYGDGKNVRDWLHVTDHCRALWLILNQGRCGETYNIGGGTNWKNLELVEKLCSILDRVRPRVSGKPYRELIHFVADRPGHDRRYAIDFSKIKKTLGWTPQHNIESGLESTLLWYLENSPWVENIRSGRYLEWMQENYQDRGNFPISPAAAKVGNC